jgi:hypothetical protein
MKDPEWQVEFSFFFLKKKNIYILGNFLNAIFGPMLQFKTP